MLNKLTMVLFATLFMVDDVGCHRAVKTIAWHGGH